MQQRTEKRPAVLLAMGPGIADQLFTDPLRARLAALADTDPYLVAHDLAAPTPGSPRRSPPPKSC